MKLYGYWRSSCSWRARIALNIKELEYTYVPIHLVNNGGEQHSSTYLSRNPQAQVPTLELASGVSLTLRLLRWAGRCRVTRPLPDRGGERW